MFKILLNFILLFKLSIADTQCPNIPSMSLDRRLSKSTFRLVQFNVEWLFIDTFSGCPGSSCTWANESEAEKHLDYIANIINDIEPDLINFCEIEGCDELNMLINKTNNNFQPYLIKGTDSATGQNVGMLTLIDPIKNLYRVNDKLTYPLNNSNCGYNGNGSTGVSKHYITKLNINSINISLISAHLLAFPTDSSRCSAREAQAQILQEQIYTLIKEGNELILLGDFNDFDNLILDINSNKPKSSVLDIMKGNLGIYAGLFELKSISNKISQESRYSDFWDKNSDCKATSNEFSMIDHILVTPYLYSKIF